MEEKHDEVEVKSIEFIDDEFEAIAPMGDSSIISKHYVGSIGCPKCQKCNMAY